jgi:hypothetical protein
MIYNLPCPGPNETPGDNRHSRPPEVTCPRKCHLEIENVDRIKTCQRPILL